MEELNFKSSLGDICSWFCREAQWWFFQMWEKSTQHFRRDELRECRPLGRRGPPQSKRRPPHRKPPTTTFKRANDRRRLRKRRRRHLLVNDHWQNCSNSRLVFCSFSSTLPFQEKGLDGHVTCSLIGSLAVNLLTQKSIDSLSSDCSFKVRPFAPLMQRCQTC